MRALFLVFALSACNTTIDPHESLVTESERSCTQDSDCVLVGLPCRCSNGFQIAVNAAGARHVEAEVHPSETCDDEVSNDPGCSAGGAGCSYGVCTLRPH